jgi:GT2 family glycosyltransferase
MPSHQAGASSPWVSVVMPVRKCRATVKKSLDALHGQDVPGRCEIIFVYDVHEDDSIEVIRSHPLAKRWDVVEMFHPGRGLAQAYNLGWGIAHSPYIFNMHSDCYPVDEHAMKRMIELLECEGALAVQPLVGIPQDDWETMCFWDRVTSSQYRHAKPTHALLGKFDLIRRSALEEVGGYDESRFFSAAEDADMVERLLSIGKIASSDVVVIHAHQHPHNNGFKATLRKHIQSGEGFGALMRKYWRVPVFLRRVWLIVGLNMLKLVLVVGCFIPQVSIYAIVLMLLLATYYARWALLSRDWRVVLIPFAVSVMFAFFAIAMVRAFIRGRQSFEYIKAN